MPLPRVCILLLLAFAFAVVPPLVQSQPATARIGLLGPDEEPRFSDMAAGLDRGLQEQGYPASAVHVLKSRVRRGDEPGARAAIQGLLGQRVTVLFVIGSAYVRLAREVAPHLPIVFVTPGDPVAAGLVASLGRPGGNMTGMTFEYPELSGKRIELLRELAPQLARVLALYDPRDASPRQGLASARSAASAMGIAVVAREVRNAEELARGLEALHEADALLGIPGGFTSAHYEGMIAAASAKKLPSIFYTRSHSTREALLTYGASDVDVARQAARAVAKILRGANAGDIPVERPAKLTLTVNARTAKALGLVVAPTLLLRADVVIE
ncbi:MAG TPA: ABC transporter substrate-binding protein [Ramlibacter sp.]|jgi:putative ABC transport system substrate-binding protein|nr:ABC transporter substrate-binding protein [Ramlibacter sp.]